MDELAEILDRLVLTTVALVQEKEEILGLILAENYFEAGMKWRDYEESIEALQEELRDARDLI